MEKQSTRDSLIESIALELKKDADRVDGGFIDRRIDELYALDGLPPPKLSDGALRAAARTIRARAAWRRRNMLAKRKLRRRFTRYVWAVCGAFLFLFSVNYISALVTGSCLPAKVDIRICCGTKFCLCGPAEGEAEKTPHPQ
jgi:hypothetical protein